MILNLTKTEKFRAVQWTSENAGELANFDEQITDSFMYGERGTPDCIFTFEQRAEPEKVKMVKVGQWLIAPEVGKLFVADDISGYDEVVRFTKEANLTRIDPEWFFGSKNYASKEQREEIENLGRKCDNAFQGYMDHLHGISRTVDGVAIFVSDTGKWAQVRESISGDILLDTDTNFERLSTTLLKFANGDEMQRCVAISSENNIMVADVGRQEISIQSPQREVMRLDKVNALRLYTKISSALNSSQCDSHKDSPQS